MNSFAISRKDGKFNPSEGRTTFDSLGFLVLRNFLPPESRLQLRTALEGELQLANERGSIIRYDEFPGAEFPLGDILAMRSLDRYQHVFFKQELVDFLKEIVGGGELAYFGDSSVQFGAAARGFHKDNVDRLDGTKPDWIGNYDLIRCGCYLQDHSKHSGGLKVRAGSHNFPTHHRGEIVDVDSRYGDLVVWSLRLTHSGNARRLRWPFLFPVHPRVEMATPSWIYRPEEARRISMFCSFGRPGIHLDRYVARMNEREDCQLYIPFARRHEEAKAILSKCGLSLVVPMSTYGIRDLV